MSLHLEKLSDQSKREFGNQHCAWFSERLQAGREVGCLANHSVLLCGADANQLADDNQAGRYANTDGELLADISWKGL